MYIYYLFLMYLLSDPNQSREKQKKKRRKNEKRKMSQINQATACQLDFVSSLPSSVDKKKTLSGICTDVVYSVC